MDQKHTDTEKYTGPFFLKTAARRRATLFIFDVFCFCLCDLVYYILTRVIYPDYAFADSVFLYNSFIMLLLVFAFRVMFGVYTNVWRYSSSLSYMKLLLADAVGGVVAVILMKIFHQYSGMWHPIMVPCLTALLTLLARFVYRQLYKKLNNPANKIEKSIPVAVVGTGEAGIGLVRYLRNNPSLKYSAKFFIDNDPGKVGSRVMGLPVYMEDEKVYDKLNHAAIIEIFIAINQLDSAKAEKMMKLYADKGYRLKVYDSFVSNFGEEEEESVAVKKEGLRDFSIEDLLFRQPIDLSQTSGLDFYKGKTVLVTGGGGSIGSEICRQLARCSVGHLIILDIYENNAYDIQQELKRTYGELLNLSVEIASVRDRKRLDTIFSYYRPQVVFHAAAHKHVPLMEHSGTEAIKNNVFGTKNCADLAEKYGVEKFILISTDKAVNPTNIMGASKRLCEMVIQSRADSETCFAAVRFGNVLGSNGSVVPLFRQQIKEGGPVTITDKRIIRYFMTIPEATQLVMTAGTMAQAGEIFVLDMGKPVKIYDLAVNMIRLSGLEPGKDIEIKEIGLRPGEKLYEELLMQSETLAKTDNELIFVEKDKAHTRQEMEEIYQALKDAVTADTLTGNCGCENVKEAIRRTVPTYRTMEEINGKVAAAD